MNEKIKGKSSFLLKVIVVVIVSLIVVINSSIIYITNSGVYLKYVDKYIAEYIDAEVSYDEVSFSYFSSFPDIKLIVRNLKINDKDSLKTEPILSVKCVEARINPMMMTFMTLDIDEIKVDSLIFNGIIDKNGKANWDVIIVDTTDTTTSNFNVKINKLKVDNWSNIVFNDNKSGTFGNVKFKSIDYKGNFNTSFIDIKINQFAIDSMSVLAYSNGAKISSEIKEITVKNSLDDNYHLVVTSENSFSDRGVIMFDKLPLNIDGSFKTDDLFGSNINVKNVELSLGEIKTGINGEIIRDSVMKHNLNLEINNLKLSTIFRLLPNQYKEVTKDINTDSELFLNVNLFTDDNNNNNVVDAKLHSNVGRMSDEVRGITLDTIFFDLKVHYNMSNSNSLTCKLNELKIKGLGFDVDSKFDLYNILNNPSLNGGLKISADVKKIAAYFTKDKLAGTGSVTLDAKGKLDLGGLSPKHIGNSDFKARMMFNDLKFSLRNDSVKAILNGGVDFGVTKNLKDSLLGINSHIIGVSSFIDSAGVNFGDTLKYSLSKLMFTVRSAASLLEGDSSKIHPVNGKFSVGMAYISAPDSAIVYFKKTKGNYSVVADKRSPSMANLSTIYNSEVLYMRDKINRISMFDTDIEFNLKEIKSPDERLQRRKNMLDSLQNIYPDISRDSLMVHFRGLRRKEKAVDEFDKYDLDLKADGDILKIISNIGATGSLSSNLIKVVSPYLPLTNTISDTKINFTQDRINVVNSSLGLGRSNLNIKGSVSNLTRVLRSNGTVVANLEMSSDSVDFDQLLHAMNAGMAFGNTSNEAYIDSLQLISSSEELQKVLDEKSEEHENQKFLIVIPRNVNLKATLAIKNGVYNNLKIDDIKSSLEIKDRTLKISELYTSTSAGVVSMSAIYQTLNKKNINAGFDLKIKDAKIGDLMSSMPAVDSLFPMMRSFDGIVNCNITSTCNIDSAMNIILPSLNSVCKIDGHKMVLLDGETFAEIAKTLKFKNKKENVIDRISVELIIHDSKAEIFPFIMSMDRYKAAISGVHNLDNSFNYHISVLDSPLPFRFGLNVFGNLENFKYRITKAKYKGEQIPSFVSVIDTTRVNLLKNINKIFITRTTKLDIMPIMGIKNEVLIQNDDSLSAEELRTIETYNENDKQKQ